jgi:hypothetical protein
MLPDRYCELLTAYVDGELSERYRKAVKRLLRRSHDARVLLRQLLENAQKLRNLPRHSLGAAFTAQVLDAIREPVQPTSTPVRPVSLPRHRTWVGWVAAAAVLLTVSLASYWVVSSLLRDSPRPEPGPVSLPGGVHPLVMELVDGTFAQYGQEIPEVGTRLAVKDIGPGMLQKETAVHLDLAVRHHPREAVNRLTQTLTETGVKVLIDQTALTSLQTGEQRTEYVVFTENLSPEEVAKLLQGMSAQVADTLLLNPLNAGHRKQIAGLMKVDSAKLEPAPFLDLKIIPKNPVPGGSKNSKSASVPVTPPPERYAVVLANRSVEGSLSNEVQQFLRTRRGNRPGTLQVVVILHQA